MIMELNQIWYITDFEGEVSMNLSKKVVLVTGSSRGIGSAIAKDFGERGSQVAVHYHKDREAAESTLSQMTGGPHMIVQADVRDPGAAENLVHAVVKKMDRIDILVNNAGIYDYHSISEISYEQWQEAWQLQIGTNQQDPPIRIGVVLDGRDHLSLDPGQNHPPCHPFRLT